MGRLADPNQQSYSRALAELEQRVHDLETRSQYANTGHAPDGNGGIESTAFDGDLAAGNAGSIGWAMNDQRAAFGELFLRPGSIGNDSLTNPVDGKVGNVSRTGFSLPPSTLTEIVGQDIAVPAGFTQCLVTAGASVFSYNPNTTGGSNGAGGDAVYCAVAVGGVYSHANPVGVSGSGGYASSFSGVGTAFSGLAPGSSLRLSVFGCSAYATLGANPDNYANAYASLIWLR